jgi:hypothetical protein
MRRMASVLAVTGAVLALGAAVAIAGSSPTVATDRATHVTNNSADLQATINPNGNSTGYTFDYGLTTAYGLTTTSHSAGSRTKPKVVGVTVRGLEPGTVYHYRVAALNRSGGAYGSDRTFKTTGPPPAAVVTGPATSILKTQATITGSVNPEGAATTWVVQYGTTPGYGLQSSPQKLAAVKTALGVAVTIPGLSPATLFHYRIVAYHGSNVVSTGSDATFFTEPAQRPKARVTARTRPSVAHKAPYTFTTNGTVRGGSYIPDSSRCSGSVRLRYYQGRRRAAEVVVPVGSDCRFTAQITFRRHGRGKAPIRVRIAIHFNGNGYLKPASRTNRVTAG